MNKFLFVMLSSSLLMMSCSPTNKKSSTKPDVNHTQSNLSTTATDYTASYEQQSTLHTLPQKTDLEVTNATSPYDDRIADSSNSPTEYVSSYEQQQNSQPIDSDIVMDRKVWLEKKKNEFLSYKNFLNEELNLGKGSAYDKMKMQQKLTWISPNLKLIERQLQEIELYQEIQSNGRRPHDNIEVAPVNDINYPIFNEQQRLRIAQQKTEIEATMKLKSKLESQKKEILKLRDDLNKELETLEGSYDEKSREQRRDIRYELSLVSPNLDSIESQLQQIELYLASMPHQ